MSPEMEELIADNNRLDNFLNNEIEKRYLPESLFVTNFLPYFCGELELTQNTKLLDMWYTIAGGQFNEVDIVDISNTVIFTVPAIVNSDIINPRANRGDLSFSDIVTLSKLKSNITPVAGDNALQQGLVIKIEQLREKKITSFSNNEERWLSIFKRYGKLEKLKDSSAIQVKGKLDEDELEF